VTVLKNRGFSLLEILAAMSIIAIVLVAVFKMHAQTISMASYSRFYTIAPLLAQSKLAELERTPLKDLSSDSGAFENEFAGYAWHTIIDDVASEALDTIADDLKKIDLRISFNNDELTYRFRTYRFAP
jgi:general secretion pathway protein I